MAAVVFDTSILVLAVNPEAKPPKNPNTDSPLEHARQRVDYLIRTLSKKKASVVIPSPVLCELLIHAGVAINDYVEKLRRAPFFIAPFDTRAAIECAQALRKHGMSGKGQDNPRAKIKFDRQIVAIAKLANAETIYSDDSDIFKYGIQANIRVVRSFDLDLDPDDRQYDLDFEDVTPACSSRRDTP
jgi:predicted nucleic acid-binding protein